MAKEKISVGKETKMDELYEKIGKFLDDHPEALDMTTDESEKLFEEWLRNGKV